MRISSIALLLLAFAAFADAWGSVGHEIIANLAWRLLSNQTRDAIREILPIHNDTRSKSVCTDCTPLGFIADWADRVRYVKGFGWSAPLHFIDISDNEIDGGCPAGKDAAATRKLRRGATMAENQTCVFVYDRDCKNDRCVAGATMNYTQQLTSYYSQRRAVADQKNASVSLELLHQSLFFLVHFVGDIHQPLHCSRRTDYGGNSIHVVYNLTRKTTEGNLGAAARVASWKEETSAIPSAYFLRNRMARRLKRNPLRLRSHHVNNLHAVWDEGLIETYLARECKASRVTMENTLWDYIMRKRHGTPASQDWLTSACTLGASLECVTQWAQESWQRAILHAYANEHGVEIQSGDVLADTYYEATIPIVLDRLAIAAVRLAATLSSALAS